MTSDHNYYNYIGCKAKFAMLIIALVFVLDVGVSGKNSAVAADLQKIKNNSSLQKIKAISNREIDLLRRSGVKTARQLAGADPKFISRVLKTDLKKALNLINNARSTQSILERNYIAQKSKFNVRRFQGAPSVADLLYAKLISPGNECTVLVRKTCGDRNQCASDPGCKTAKLLLDGFNAGDAAGADYCLVALEDAVVFAFCPR